MAERAHGVSAAKSTSAQVVGHARTKYSTDQVRRNESRREAASPKAPGEEQYYKKSSSQHEGRILQSCSSSHQFLKNLKNVSCEYDRLNGRISRKNSVYSKVAVLSINNHIVGLVHKNHIANEIPGIE